MIKIGGELSEFVARRAGMAEKRIIRGQSRLYQHFPRRRPALEDRPT